MFNPVPPIPEEPAPIRDARDSLVLETEPKIPLGAAELAAQESELRQPAELDDAGQAAAWNAAGSQRQHATGTSAAPDATTEGGGKAVPAAQHLHKALEERAKAMEYLQEDTLEWLHLDHYGKPLPEDATYQRRDAVRRQTSAFVSMLKHYRRRLWSLMTEPDSSVVAMLISYFMVVTILLSTVSFVLSTLPEYSEERNPSAYDAFGWIELVCVQVFLVDYVLRLVSCPNILRFVIQPLNIIDLVSIVPWYVELGLSGSDLAGTSVFRVLRLLRVFRVLKLGSRFNKLLVITSALINSLDMLLMLSFLVSLLVVIAATLMYFAERGEYDEALGYYVRKHETASKPDGNPIVSPYESIPAGFWWAIVTIMTVGYGDVFPISAGGRIIACVTMICGLLTLALPIAVIGANFTSEWEAYKKKEGGQDCTSHHVRQLLDMLGGYATLSEDLMRMFNTADSKLDEARDEVVDKASLRQRDVELTLQQRHSSFSAAQRAAAMDLVAQLSSLGAGTGLGADAPASVSGSRQQSAARFARSKVSAASNAAAPGSTAALLGGAHNDVGSAGGEDLHRFSASRIDASGASGGGQQHGANGRGKRAADPAVIKAAVDALEGTTLHNRLTSELTEVVEGEEDLSSWLSFLGDLLRATDLLQSCQVQQHTEHMRVHYRQLQLMERQAAELRGGVSSLADELNQLEALINGANPSLRLKKRASHELAPKPGLGTASTSALSPPAAHTELQVPTQTPPLAAARLEPAKGAQLLNRSAWSAAPGPAMEPVVPSRMPSERAAAGEAQPGRSDSGAMPNAGGLGSVMRAISNRVAPEPHPVASAPEMQLAQGGLSQRSTASHGSGGGTWSSRDGSS